jgi:hypothetical protein
VKPCTTSVAAPTIGLGVLTSGTTRRTFTGRGPNGRALPAGSYAATATARDAAGNLSKAVVLRFTIVS